MYYLDNDIEGVYHSGLINLPCTNESGIPLPLQAVCENGFPIHALLQGFLQDLWFPPAFQIGMLYVANNPLFKKYKKSKDCFIHKARCFQIKLIKQPI